MGDKSAIEWTDATWNPVTGCSKVSAGCKNCYAERVFPRSYPGRAFTDVRTHPDRLKQPIHWRKPRRVFVNSMSDLFHEDVSDEFIAEVWRVMYKAPRHTYQILTKRPERMLSMMPRLVATFGVLDCAWLGVSCEDQRTADERIPILLQTPAAVRFVSVEPLLGPVSFRWAKWDNWKHSDGSNRPSVSHLDGLRMLDWVIVGGESGPKARPMHAVWVRSIRDQCVGAEVPLFFKQWGGVRPKANGRELDGLEWSQFPELSASPEPDVREV